MPMSALTMPQWSTISALVMTHVHATSARDALALPHAVADRLAAAELHLLAVAAGGSVRPSRPRSRARCRPAARGRRRSGRTSRHRRGAGCRHQFDRRRMRCESAAVHSRSDDRACKAVGGRAAALRCGGRRCAPTRPRGARVPGGARRTRPRTGGISLRELPVLGAQTGCARRIAFWRCATPAPLRSSAPQRRSAARPPTALRAPPSGSKTSATDTLVAIRRSLARRAARSRRGAGGRRALRSGARRPPVPLRRSIDVRAGGAIDDVAHYSAPCTSPRKPYARRAPP